MYKLLGLDAAGQRALCRAIFACVVSNITLLASFGITMNIIQVLLRPLMAGGEADVRLLWKLFAAAVGAMLLYALAQRSEYRKTYTASYSEAEKIRLELAERIRRLPLSFFNRKDVTELTTNIMADCTTIEHTMSHVLPGLAANLITITLASAALAFYDWRMAASLFCVLPLAAAIVLVSKGVQAKWGARVAQRKLDAAERAQEYLEGIKVVKAFGLSGEKFEALAAAVEGLMKDAFKFELITGVFVVSASMILQAGIGIVTFAGVALLTAGAIDPAKMLFFVLISSKIYGPVIVILTMLAELFFWLISIRRMDALRKEPIMTGDENVEELKDFTIVMRNVSFAYNEREVIKNISLTIPQNGVTALVGPSGSGKTTLSRLVARFWDAGAGEITIGGADIRGIDPETLMRFMSFVFQDVVLFNDTVMNNIRIGKKDASDEEVRAAAKIARCDEFVNAMPRGYDTLIGENGCTLSGGERQRVSIARALLKNAPIVLLDEATASLDPENEGEIQAAISELVKGRTVIVIAHRLRTVLGADKIAVLENGALVEEGTGEELLARNGLFARLYATQRESMGWTAKARA